jgi:hypothetical protein
VLSRSVRDCERLNARWRCEAEGVDALVVITSRESNDTRLDDRIDELEVNRVEILKFVDDQMFGVELLDRIKRSGTDSCHTLPNNLTR